MAYNLQVNRNAEKDIEEAIAWYEEQRAGLGIEFFVELLSVTEQISLHPMRFPSEYAPHRKALMTRFPYAIHFGVNTNAGEVAVLAVWHTKRNPKVLKKRLK